VKAEDCISHGTHREGSPMERDNLFNKLTTHTPTLAHTHTHTLANTTYTPRTLRTNRHTPSVSCLITCTLPLNRDVAHAAPSARTLCLGRMGEGAAFGAFRPVCRTGGSGSFQCRLRPLNPRSWEKGKGSHLYMFAGNHELVKGALLSL